MIKLCKTCKWIEPCKTEHGAYYCARFPRWEKIRFETTGGVPIIHWCGEYTQKGASNRENKADKDNKSPHLTANLY